MNVEGRGTMLRPVFITVGFNAVKEQSMCLIKKARAFVDSDLRDAHSILNFKVFFHLR